MKWSENFIGSRRTFSLHTEDLACLGGLFASLSTFRGIYEILLGSELKYVTPYFGFFVGFLVTLLALLVWLSNFCNPNWRTSWIIPPRISISFTNNSLIIPNYKSIDENWSWSEWNWKLSWKRKQNKKIMREEAMHFDVPRIFVVLRCFDFLQRFRFEYRWGQLQTWGRSIIYKIWINTQIAAVDETEHCSREQNSRNPKLLRSFQTRWNWKLPESASAKRTRFLDIAQSRKQQLPKRVNGQRTKFPRPTFFFLCILQFFCLPFSLLI